MKKSDISRLAGFVGMVCFALMVAGCAPKTAANIQTAEEFGQVGAENAIVFGQIEWLENGEPKKIGDGLFDMWVEPHLMRMEDRARIAGKISEDGKFVWSLKPGMYFMHKMVYRDPWSGNYFIIPKVAFSVPQSGKAYYIGTLKCEFKPERDFIGGLSGKVAFAILDDANRSIPGFQEQFAIAEAEKSLMVHDLRLPNTVETTAEYNMALSIINMLLFGASQ